MLYKLVLGPIPIVHTNFQDNPLTTLGISRHFKIIELILFGSVGHQQHIFRLFITVSVSFEGQKIKIKINWVSGSPPMLCKLVLGPIPILHTNFQQNRHFQTFKNYLVNFIWVSESPTTYFPFILSLFAFILKTNKFI